MAPPVRTETEPVRRDQLLTAARKVFREKGYEGATVSDIVEEAGVAQGTFYLYFPSKKDVVMALAQRVMEEMNARLQASYDPTLSFEERLRGLIRTAFEVGSDYPDLCRLLHLGAESMVHEFHETKEAHAVRTGMVQMFQQAIDAGEMEAIDPEMVARLLTRMVPGALQEAYVFGDGSDAGRLEEALEQIVVNGLKRHS